MATQATLLVMVFFEAKARKTHAIKKLMTLYKSTRYSYPSSKTWYESLAKLIRLLVTLSRKLDMVNTSSTALDTESTKWFMSSLLLWKETIWNPLKGCASLLNLVCIFQVTTVFVSKTAQPLQKMVQNSSQLLNMNSNQK